MPRRTLVLCTSVILYNKFFYEMYFLFLVVKGTGKGPRRGAEGHRAKSAPTRPACARRPPVVLPAAVLLCRDQKRKRQR